VFSLLWWFNFGCATAVVCLLGYGLGFQPFRGLRSFLCLLAAPFVVYLTKSHLVATTFLGLCTIDIYMAASFICCIPFYFLFTYTDVVISGFFVGLPNSSNSTSHINVYQIMR
jgi:hypothetical protein